MPESAVNDTRIAVAKANAILRAEGRGKGGKLSQNTSASASRSATMRSNTRTRPWADYTEDDGPNNSYAAMPDDHQYLATSDDEELQTQRHDRIWPSR